MSKKSIEIGFGKGGMAQVDTSAVAQTSQKLMAQLGTTPGQYVSMPSYPLPDPPKEEGKTEGPTGQQTTPLVETGPQFQSQIQKRVLEMQRQGQGETPTPPAAVPMVETRENVLHRLGRVFTGRPHPVEPMPETPAQSNMLLRDALLKVSKEGMGTPSRGIPNTDQGNLACCAMLQGALYATTGKKMGNLNVFGMRDALDKDAKSENGNFEKVAIDPRKDLKSQLQPGDIIVSCGKRDKNGNKAPGAHGHIGIVGEDGQIYSNSSGKRAWDKYYDGNKWDKVYTDSYVYRPRVGAVATNDQTLAQGVDRVHGTSIAANAPAPRVTPIDASPRFQANQSGTFQHGAETATKGLTARQKASLDMVARYEGTYGTYGYYKRVHGGHCETADGCVTREELQRKDRVAYSAKIKLGDGRVIDNTDTGIGRYQMHHDTYNECSKLSAKDVPPNLKQYFTAIDPKHPNGMMKVREDLSPEQKSDLTALVLMQKKGALDKFEKGNVEGGLGNLKNMWSVAGNPWGHKEDDMAKKKAFFEARVAYYEAQERGDTRGMQMAMARTEELLGRKIKNDPQAETILAQANDRRLQRDGNGVVVAGNQPANRPSAAPTVVAASQSPVNGQQQNTPRERHTLAA